MIIQHNRPEETSEQSSIQARLRALEERFDLLVRATNDGLWDWDIIADAVVFSDRWKAQLGYAPDEIGNSIEEWQSRIHPDDLNHAVETIRGCVDGANDSYELEHRLRHRDGTWRWICARGAVKRDERGRAVRLAGSHQDIHDRKVAEQHLGESQRVLMTLFSNLPVMIYQCFAEDPWKFCFVSQGARQITGYPEGQIQVGYPIAYLDIVHPDDQQMLLDAIAEANHPGGEYQVTYRITTIDSELKWVWDEGHFLCSGDSTQTFREGFIFDITDRMTAYDLLEHRVEARTRELSTLLEVSRGLISTIELQPLLELILGQIGEIVENQAASIAMIDNGYVTTIANRRPAGVTPMTDTTEHRYRIPEESQLWSQVQAGDIVIVDDVRGDSPLARDYRKTVGSKLDTHYRHVASWMGIPLMLKERVIGAIVMASSTPGHYTEHDGQLVMSLGHFAAIAIDNARLHEQTRSLAALEERQRLARELHDSVSQALYGIALGAETARAMLERDPELANKPLDYVLSLARAGMAEMRALIFELRPESLEKEGLVAALEKQTSAIEARHGIEIYAELGSEPDAALQVKEALYRIAQEAMHNTVKHGHATSIELTLERCAEDRLRLVIHDNGKGFDVTATFPGHLGLISMRERAARGNGAFQIESSPERGTRIVVEIPT